MRSSLDVSGRSGNVHLFGRRQQISENRVVEGQYCGFFRKEPSCRRLSFLLTFFFSSNARTRKVSVASIFAG